MQEAIGEAEEITTFRNFPLLYHTGHYRIPDPKLSSVLGEVVPYDTPLEASAAEVEAKFKEFEGMRVDIRGTVQGWLHNWYPTSVMTGIKVLDIQLSKLV